MLPNSDAILVSLLGMPLSHSQSPLIHNTAFQKLGLGLHYFLCPIEKEQIQVVIDLIREGKIIGSNVTIPYKAEVIDYLDDLSPAAKFVQAVNTISRYERDGVVRLRGDNTDVVGFFAPLEQFEDRLQQARVLVIGTGGSARAVVYSLSQNLGNPRIHISSRDLERASNFSNNFAKMGIPDLHPCTADHLVGKDFDLVVNCTPMGMHPDITQMPLADSFEFNSEQIVYDLIYNPGKTLLLQKAQEAGAIGINGLEMLIQQAAASFKIWTGEYMPLAEVRKALGGGG